MNVKKSRATHPGLLALANKLQTIQFDTPLTAGETEALNTRGAFGLKGVAYMPSMRENFPPVWLVKMCFQGTACTVGILHSDPKPEALQCVARFADMCRAKFWPYRLRGRKPPVDAELNISADRAQNDLKFESNAIALVEEIERFLLANQIVKPAEECAAAIKEFQKTRVQGTRNALKVLANRDDEILTRLNTLVTTNEARLDGVCSLLGDIRAELNRITDTQRLIVQVLDTYINHPPATGQENNCCTPLGGMLLSK